MLIRRLCLLQKSLFLVSPNKRSLPKWKIKRKIEEAARKRKKAHKMVHKVAATMMRKGHQMVNQKVMGRKQNKRTKTMGQLRKIQMKKEVRGTTVQSK